MMGLQSTGHALVRSALHKAGSRQICVCKARSTDTLLALLAVMPSKTCTS